MFRSAWPTDDRRKGLTPPSRPFTNQGNDGSGKWFARPHGVLHGRVNSSLILLLNSWPVTPGVTIARPIQLVAFLMKRFAARRSRQGFRWISLPSRLWRRRTL